MSRTFDEVWEELKAEDPEFYGQAEKLAEIEIAKIRTLVTIRKLIKQSGKSQKQIAEEIGVTPQRLNDWIADRRPLRACMIPVLCKAIGCSPNDVFKDGEL